MYNIYSLQLFEHISIDKSPQKLLSSRKTHSERV